MPHILPDFMYFWRNVLQVKSRLVLLLLLFVSMVSGQRPSPLLKNTSFRIACHHGWLIPEYPFAKLQAVQPVNGFELSYEKQADGSLYWHRLYRNPIAGVSLFHSGLGNPDIFGTQTALFFHTGSSFYKPSGSFAIPWQLGIGLCYVSKKHDADNNIFNVAVGSHINIYFRAYLGWELAVFKKLKISQGLTFNHLSNANMSEPNIGLNWLMLTHSISFLPQGKAIISRTDIPDPDHSIHHQFLANIGVKHTRSFESYKYATASLSYTAIWIPGHIVALGLGADLFYDSSVKDEMRTNRQPFKQRYYWHSGIHAEQKMVYNKMSFGIQEGVYLGFAEKVNNHTFYNRAFIQRKLNRNLSVMISVKTHLHILDHVEFGLGWNFAGRRTK